MNKGKPIILTCGEPLFGIVHIARFTNPHDIRTSGEDNADVNACFEKTAQGTPSPTKPDQSLVHRFTDRSHQNADSWIYYHIQYPPTGGAVNYVYTMFTTSGASGNDWSNCAA
ncbi:MULTISPECIES: hypothetical protein [unclassified Streptomyces]|uniref:hypothetical protein n=1 Tax=unclassified Streptomyces TaxID=2593676 RepID=UPI0037F3B83A